MAAEYEISAALGRAFHAALLLTGSPVSAEHAVSRAIESLSFDGFNSNALLNETIEVVVRSYSHPPEQTHVDTIQDWLGLPGELRAVIRMSAPLRYCFVLRLLLHFPVEDCAWLLKIRPVDVRARTSEAMQWLAVNAAPAPSSFSAWPEVVASYSPLWQ